MEHYLQSVALILIAAILGILLSEQNKSAGAVLSLGACCMVLVGLARYVQPLLELMKEIRELAGVSGQMLSLLLKAVGISLIAQLAELICKDAGQTALGKAICLAANAVTLWVSIPLIEELLELIQEVLGAL